VGPGAFRVRPSETATKQTKKMPEVDRILPGPRLGGGVLLDEPGEGVSESGISASLRKNHRFLGYEGLPWNWRSTHEAVFARLHRLIQAVRRI
jgi:hypothetical protein